MNSCKKVSIRYFNSFFVKILINFCNLEYICNKNSVVNYFSPKLYSPFCVLAKVTKLVGLKNGGRVSPTNLVTFAGTQNGE
jgi:hypothetical protein